MSSRRGSRRLVPVRRRGGVPGLLRRDESSEAALGRAPVPYVFSHRVVSERAQRVTDFAQRVPVRALREPFLPQRVSHFVVLVLDTLDGVSDHGVHVPVFAVRIAVHARRELDGGLRLPDDGLPVPDFAVPEM